MVAESSIWLLWVTYSFSVLYMVTLGYIWLQWVTYILTGLHMVTVHCICLSWVTHTAKNGEFHDSLVWEFSLHPLLTTPIGSFVTPYPYIGCISAPPKKFWVI